MRSCLEVRQIAHRQDLLDVEPSVDERQDLRFVLVEIQLMGEAVGFVRRPQHRLERPHSRVDTGEVHEPSNPFEDDVLGVQIEHHRTFPR